MMGFSLGGSMTIKLMGEPHEGLPIFAAVAVSAPLDLTVGSAYLNQMGFGLYEKFLVAGLKRQALQPGPRGTLRVSPQEHEAIRAATAPATAPNTPTMMPSRRRAMVGGMRSSITRSTRAGPI